jgi:hypothetical protein
MQKLGFNHSTKSDAKVSNRRGNYHSARVYVFTFHIHNGIQQFLLFLNVRPRISIAFGKQTPPSSSHLSTERCASAAFPLAAQ